MKSYGNKNFLDVTGGVEHEKARLMILSTVLHLQNGRIESKKGFLVLAYDTSRFQHYLIFSLPLILSVLFIDNKLRNKILYPIVYGLNVFYIILGPVRSKMRVFASTWVITGNFSLLKKNENALNRIFYNSIDLKCFP